MKVLRLYPVIFSCFVLPVFGQSPGLAPHPGHAYTTSGIFNEDGASGDSAPGVVPVVATAAPAPSYLALTARQKFVRSTIGTFGPTALVFDAAGAGYEQLTNSPGPWGQGSEAFGLRFASTFGINFVNQYSQFALSAALHEDPRYFPSMDRSFKARVKSALKQTVISRTDSGGERFAFAKIGGALTAGFASNAWLPRTDNSPADGLETAGVLVALNAAFNLAQEFVPLFRHIQ